LDIFCANRGAVRSCCFWRAKKEIIFFLAEVLLGVVAEKNYRSPARGGEKQPVLDPFLVNFWPLNPGERRSEPNLQVCQWVSRAVCLTGAMPHRMPKQPLFTLHTTHRSPPEKHSFSFTCTGWLLPASCICSVLEEVRYVTRKSRNVFLSLSPPLLKGSQSIT
jgi:hypothetical protein